MKTPAGERPGKKAAMPGPVRRRRADAERNRDRLIEAAKAAFAAEAGDTSLEAIARRAGVGIGTLYRHFPTRGAILEAVYRREVAQLAGAAATLLETMPAAAALHAWMRLFVDYIATKRVVAAALSSIIGDTGALYANSGEDITRAMALLVERAREAGEIQPEVDPQDLLRALIGFTYGNTVPAWQASARRLIDLLMAGLKVPGSAA